MPVRVKASISLMIFIAFVAMGIITGAVGGVWPVRFVGGTRLRNKYL